MIEADLVRREHTRAPSASSSTNAAQSSPNRIPYHSSPRLNKGWKSRRDDDDNKSIGRTDSSPTLSSLRGHTGRSISEATNKATKKKSGDFFKRRTNSYLLSYSNDNSEKAHAQAPGDSEGSQATQEKTSSTMSLHRLVRIVTGMRSSRQGTTSDLFNKSEDDGKETVAPALHHGGSLLCALVSPRAL